MWNPALTSHDNLGIFGKCANPAGHGHGYRLEVTVKARVSEGNPFVMRRREVNRIIDDVLNPKLECCDLNTVFGHGFLSSGENIAMAVWTVIEKELPAGVALAAVKVIETNRNVFAYCGGKAAGTVPCVI
jgi:6-pyruvoyltetrahydropterin/6-carboxytetrahydropterin synthase